MLNAVQGVTACLFVCCCLVFLDVFIDSFDVILSSFLGENAYIEKMSAHTTLQFSSHHQRFHGDRLPHGCLRQQRSSPH